MQKLNQSNAYDNYRALKTSGEKLILNKPLNVKTTALTGLS